MNTQMRKNINISDNRFNQAELTEPILVEKNIEFESQVNSKNNGQGLKIVGQDEVVIYASIRGSMPAGARIVLMPVIQGFPPLDKIDLTLPVVTNGITKARLFDDDSICDADFLKVLYRFVGSDKPYTIQAICLQVKKR